MVELKKMKSDIKEKIGLFLAGGLVKDIMKRITWRDEEFIKRLREEVTPLGPTKEFQEEYIWNAKDLNKVIDKLSEELNGR